MFLESILFLQKLKNFKNSVILFWRLSRGSSKSHASATNSRVKFGELFASEGFSREGYTEIFVGSGRDSLAGRPSNRKKHLEIFFTILSLSVLAARPGSLLATHFSCEKRVFGKNWVSF